MFREQATTIELSLPNELGYEKLVRHTLAWLAARLGFDAARIADIQTAVSEACINAIEHGNQGAAERRVRVALSYANDYLDATIVDEGVLPFCPLDGPPATIEQKLAGLAAPRGMGLFLISQLVDEAGFLPTCEEQGNHYWLRVYRDRRPRSSTATWLTSAAMCHP